MRSFLPIPVLAFGIVFALSSTLQATELKLSSDGVINLVDNSGATTKTYPLGTISEPVAVDGQSFKLSYGKDLQGRHTLILYPNPENPQSVNLTTLGQAVQLSKDSVLTILTSPSSGTAVFQSGVLGGITVGGQELPPGGAATCSNGIIQPATTPEATIAATKAQAPASGLPPAENAPETNTPIAPSEHATGGPGVYPIEGNIRQERLPLAASGLPVAAYQGMIVREVEGDVFVSNAGTDPLEALRNAVESPRAKPGQIIPEGAMIKTGPNSRLMMSPFPGAVVQIQQNSAVGIKKALYQKSGTGYQRAFNADLQKGGVLAAIKGIKPEELDFKVQTPQAVAAARGTVFAVYSDGVRTLIVGSDGTVTVITPDGVYQLKVDAGGKLVITSRRPGQPPDIGEFAASPEELAALGEFLRNAEKYLGMRDIFATGDSLDDPNLKNLSDFFHYANTDPRLNPGFATPIKNPGTDDAEPEMPFP